MDINKHPGKMIIETRNKTPKTSLYIYTKCVIVYLSYCLFATLSPLCEIPYIKLYNRYLSK